MFALTAASAWAQETPGTSDAEKPTEATEKKDDEREKKDGVKPYDEVITKDAKTDPGLFFVHRVDSKVYYEIPTERAVDRHAVGHANRRHAGGFQHRRHAGAGPRRALGAARRKHSAARRQIRDPRRRRRPDQGRGGAIVHQADHSRVSGRGLGQRQGAGDRRDGTLQERRRRIQRQAPVRRLRHGRQADLHRRNQIVPGKRRGQGARNVYAFRSGAQ